MVTLHPRAKLAHDRDKTPFDYIIVGSGAGGGPLAARLALAGKSVLVLEAGIDPGAAGRSNEGREAYHVPGYHGASTECTDVSWHFSVRHYSSTDLQATDTKYDAKRDPSAQISDGRKGGILYPRAAAVGGCTAHHAMILIKPDANDWNRLATATGDDSWRAESMQGYFARIEQCLYYTQYDQAFRKLLGVVYTGWRRLLAFLDPRRQLDWGGHGFSGWQPTSFIDPALVRGIAKGDRAFRRVLTDVIENQPLTTFGRALARLRLVRLLDPNFGHTRAVDGSALAMIPVGTDGKNRIGVREHLQRTADDHPERLVVQTQMHVTRVIFAAPAQDGPPRAIGVTACAGAHLYDASPLRDAGANFANHHHQFFAKHEVILCGGAFNTPQLLMLSGIGDTQHLQHLRVPGPRNENGKPVAEIVHLPGVGRNLQDRYEISVVSEADEDFTTLEGLSFAPGDTNDRARLEWLRTGRGLYATNGGALAMFVRTAAARPETQEPDLFVFGFPAAFRGYYWGWSNELLKPTKGASGEARNLWSWVILKAHTNNDTGTVRLHSSSPFEQPQIDFCSFPANRPNDDLVALKQGIEWVRALNGRIRPFANEIQPGAVNDARIEDWIRAEAWGHHACGTCRMGRDPWVADPQDLTDRGAVLDSEFRVQGVCGLRVVDASIFPEIPGYFIATSIFMASEKAADVLLADPKEYPRALEAEEAAAVLTRRLVAGAGADATASTGATDTNASDAGASDAGADADTGDDAANVDAHGAGSNDARDDGRLPADTVGLALSGGGIRSATFCLGALQALAQLGRLCRVDFLSTVSGGGYIGSFLGRLYTRPNTPRRVQETLKNVASPQIWWLRQHANYIGGEGRSDLMQNVGVVWRNLLLVHFAIGILLVAVLGVLRLAGDAWLQGFANTQVGSFTLSPWWWTVPAAAVLALVPAWIGYWLVPRHETALPYPPGPLFAWLGLLAAGVAGLLVDGLGRLCALLICVLLLGWVWQEAARWGLGHVATAQRPLNVRNRLTRALGEVLFRLPLLIGFVAIDTLARAAAEGPWAFLSSIGMASIAAALPVLRQWAMRLTRSTNQALGDTLAKLERPIAAALLAAVLLAFLVFALDVLVHSAFRRSPAVGGWLVVTAIGVSVLVGQAWTFLNGSSFQQLYAARIARAFLGATNPSRVSAPVADATAAVQTAHPGDDQELDQYHPEIHGGPLHLVNICVNQTVDPTSGAQLAMDKALPMCVGPRGTSVGVRYHALWKLQGGRELHALPTGADPQSFHVLAHSRGAPVRPESLPIGVWTSISGAAFGTASGRTTHLFVSLLMGLFNIRLGYWWNSGIDAGKRPGRYPPSPLRRIRAALSLVFRTQSTIIDEWRAHFPGASDRFWYLSDGGHFENTGAYELIRRRLPLIVCVDASYDPDYRFDDMALLAQRVRLDFGATITWLRLPVQRPKGWRTLDDASAALKPKIERHAVDGCRLRDQASAAVEPRIEIPAWIKQWIDPDAIGDLSSIRPGGAHAAALAHIDYGAVPRRSGWLLLIKAACLSEQPAELASYAARNSAFPHDPTANQFFDKEQWESYRLLGQTITRAILEA